MNNRNKSKGLSWTAVIIVLIFFWPVGLFLLWKKVSYDKSAVLQKSKSLSVIGWVMLILGISFVMRLQNGGVSSSDQSSTVGGTLIPIVIFLGGGLALIINAKRMKRKGEKYKKYISIVVNQRMTSIDNIAVAAQVSYDEAVADLQNMIDFGYFENGYIDAGRREVILLNSQPEFYTPNPMQSEPTQKPRVVTCKSCGANNTVAVNTVHVCEYCGLPLP